MGCSRIVNACEKTVFLTFDDGIHPGTQEVYDVVKSRGVKATFFLTGAHVRFAVTESNQKPLLLSLANDPDIDIGNHSNSHMNYFAQGYYENGGVKLVDG